MGDYKMLVTKVSGAVMLALSLSTTAVTAQESGREQPTVEEVVVTAQRRVERLQDVPVSVQVFGEVELAGQNLTSLQSLAEASPSVHIKTTVGRSGEMFIRGIGSGNNQSFDQSVGVFVDELYHGRVKAAASTFLDLERVEVLKGPQSTFFGNNAIAGAYNIVSKKPTDEVEAAARVLYGEHGQYAAEGAVGGSLSERLAGRIAATTNGMNGWVTNVFTGHDQPDQHNAAGRVTLRFTPNDDLTGTFKTEASRNRDYSGLYTQIDQCPPPPQFTVAGNCRIALQRGYPVGFDQNQNANNPGQSIFLDTFENALTIDYQRGGHTFTSVTGYYDYDYNLDFDGDGIPMPVINVQIPEKYHQFSQEFRLASPVGQTLEYLAGAYFHTGTIASTINFSFYNLTPVITSTPAFASLVPYLPLGQNTSFRQSEDVYSVFGSAGWNATDRVKVTVGLRASLVEKDLQWSKFFGTATLDYGGIVALPSDVATVPSALLGGTGTINLSREDDAVMPSANVQYRMSPNAMVYVSYARGFKAGGLNAGENNPIAANFPFDPEYVNAYEAGLKSEWLDKRLLLNLTAFRSDYDDLQVVVNLFTPAGNTLSFVRNAAAAISQGAELETQWAIADPFRISAAITWLDAYYESYPNGSPTQDQLRQGILVQDLSGQETSFAPRTAGTVSGTYSTSLGNDYRFTGELTARYSSSYFLGLANDPLQHQRAYTRVDARLSLEAPDGRYALDLIGKNLTDRNIYTFISVLTGARGSIIYQKEEPRNFAVQFRYRW